MGEEVDAFARIEFEKGIGGGCFEGLECARGGLSDMGLELGECVFDGIEVGTVRRKVEKFGATGLDGLLDAGDFVSRP